MEYIWQISFPLFSFLFEMNCRLAASNVWHSFSFSLLGLNPNTNLNFTSSALFVNILAVAAKCFPKAHKTQNPKGKYCLATIKICILPPMGSSLRAEPAVRLSPPRLAFLPDFEREWWVWSWGRRDESPRHPVWAQLQPQQCQCHFFPQGCRGSK